MTRFISNREIYEQVIRERVSRTRGRLWIATADIKDTYFEAGGNEMVPFPSLISAART